MRYRNFGSSDLVLSEWCFGAMRFAGPNDGGATSPTVPEPQDEIGRQALEAALDGGVNAIHSSDDYGTRWLLTEALQHHPKRSEIHHVIKVTTPDYDETTFDPSAFRATIEQALTELHTERIAVVQHLQRGPQVSKADAYSQAGDERRITGLTQDLEILAETFDTLRDEGKVGYLATFPHTMGYARAALSTGAFHGVAHYMNLVELEALEVLDELDDRGLGFLAIRPLLQGMLTDKRADRDTLPDDDPLRRTTWDGAYARWRDVAQAIGTEPASWTRYAIGFALAHPTVTSVVAGANDVAQTEALLAACDGDYPSRQTLDALRSVVAESGMLPKSDFYA